MRRYGIDARPLFAATSGIPLYTRRLIENMGAHLRDDEELSVYLPTPINPASNLWDLWRGMRNRNWGPKVEFDGSGSALWLHALLETRLKLKILPVDMSSVLGDISIFHATHHELLRCKRARRVITMYDLAAIKYPEHHNALQREAAGYYAELCRDADAVICISESTKNDVIDLLDVNPSKVFAIHIAAANECNGAVDSDQIAEIRNKYDLPDRFIAYLGTIEPRKNLVNLIKAYNLAVETHSISHHLILAGGGGWLNDDIYNEAGISSNSDRIRFLGFIPDGDVAGFLSCADLFAYLSFMEGFGLPVLEAFQCGVPVLTSNTSSMPEIAGDAAVLVNPHDVEEIAGGIARILENTELSKTLIERGKRQVRKFSWDECAGQTLDVYRSLVT